MAHEPANRTLRYHVVVDEIRELIRRGDLQPGDRLPPERDLAERLSVGRSTVREALRGMQREGLVETRPGGGNFVRSIRQATPDGSRFIANLEKAAILDLLEVREMLEAKAVELACLRATEADMDAISAALEAGIREANHKQGALSADEEFHLAIAQASDNPVLYNIMKLHLDMLRRTRELMTDLPGRTAEMLDEHRAIGEAIRRRNSSEAVAALHRHLQSIRKRLTQAVVERN